MGNVTKITNPIIRRISQAERRGDWDEAMRLLAEVGDRARRLLDQIEAERGEGVER